MALPFNATYSCCLIDINYGGKIIMPPSALEELKRLKVNYPMLFKITNEKTNCKTHCGVAEFVADEGKVYLPLWIMQNLVLEEGSLIQIENVSLPVGTFAKFQPVSDDFLDINNTKAVLKNCLQTFACLTANDVIAITYKQKVYKVTVVETKPDEAISIDSHDMNLEIVGYKECSNHRRKDEIGNTSDVKQVPGSMDLLNESNHTISELQERLGDIREKYTAAIEKLMHRRNKLEIKELKQRCQNITVASDRPLIIPDLQVPIKVESQCTDTDVENLEKLKTRARRHMSVMKTLTKIKNCPIAQAMLEL